MHNCHLRKCSIKLIYHASVTYAFLMLYLQHFKLYNNHPLYIELMFCIATNRCKKGRRISPTPSLLSGFICSYLRYFLMCYLLLHLIHVSSLKCIICLIFHGIYFLDYHQIFSMVQAYLQQLQYKKRSVHLRISCLQMHQTSLKKDNNTKCI